MNRISAKAFLTKVNDFLQEAEKLPLVKAKLGSENQLADLFRFWYMDCREQEILQDHEERDENDPFGLGDMLGGD